MVEQIALSIIVVNWKVPALLTACLRSVLAETHDHRFEVIVVDNNSADGSVELVRCDFPEVKLIANGENIGFARASNQGMGEAQGRYLCLLNPDTVCLDNCLSRMVDLLDEHPEVGLVGPKLLNADWESVQYWGARRLPRPRDAFFEYTKLSRLFPRSRLLGRYLMGDWDHASSCAVESLSGACMMIRRTALEQVGMLDEEYPLYWEDTDWCHRIGRAGWIVYYLAEARLIHLGGQSTVQSRGPSAVKSVRGTYRYFRKFHGTGAAWRVWFLLWLVSLGKLVAWALVALSSPKKRNLAIQQVSAYWAVCRMLPSLI